MFEENRDSVEIVFVGSDKARGNYTELVKNWFSEHNWEILALSSRNNWEQVAVVWIDRDILSEVRGILEGGDEPSFLHLVRLPTADSTQMDVVRAGKCYLSKDQQIQASPSANQGLGASPRNVNVEKYLQYKPKPSGGKARC